MAASFLQKFLKKSLPSPPLRILTSLTKTQLPNPMVSPFLNLNPDPDPDPDPNPNPNPNLNPNPIPIYPSFPHCFTLKPIYLHDLSQSDGEVGSGGGGDGAEMWADSVKKKRKRKMNKHKLRKLRKMLRRKTKN